MSHSIAAYERAKNVMPGGVNSPVRAFSTVGLTPVFATRGQGARVYDMDGNEYIDYIGSWGPLIFGHARPEIVKAIQEVAACGTSFGLSTELEVKMAEHICNSMPSIEMVRMVNSGTEATMSALRVARGYTQRQKIVKFQGGYHGHADALLTKSGSGVATLGLPDSPGVPDSVATHTLTAPYNSMDKVRFLFERYGEQIAAVIVEPVAGNMGVIPPAPGFLEGLRHITKEYGSLLIFDEVMTGYRVGPSGAQGRYEIIPDLTCLGKIIGGGLPVGAYGGKREIMEQVAPAGAIYQAGTLSGNPIAMAAGYTTLKLLEQDGIYEELERKSARLEAGFLDCAKRRGVPLQINRVGSMFSAFFAEHSVMDYNALRKANMQHFISYYKEMLAFGILTAPTPYEVTFISVAHTDEDIDKTINAHDQALAKI